MCPSSEFTNIICETVNHECCMICGEKHNAVNCSVVNVSKHVFDKEIPSRAKLTLPDFFELKTMSDGTYSVITKNDICKGTRFGPFYAEKTQTLEPSIFFPLKIFSNDRNVNTGLFLNTCDQEKCNWLMYIGPADHVEEQNLICYQEKDEIFYITIKDISADDSLKVWYSPYYASKMNQKLLASKIVSDETIKDIDINSLIKKQQKIMERKIWTCKFCSQIEHEIVPFARHILKHYAAQHKNMCEICKKVYGSKRLLKNHLKIVHKSKASNSAVNIAKNVEENKKTNSKEIVLGGPLLNDLFTDSSDLQQSDLSQFDLNMDNQNLLLDSDNLTVENLLSENVKDLDHFNFEIDEMQKQFVCDICLKQFNKSRLLILHLRHHTGDYLCKKCLKIFCRKENLKAHICNINSIYQCNLCPRSFRLKKYLSRHLDAVHYKKFHCVICNKNYYSNKELIEHNCSKIPVAEKEKFMCPICDKFFFRDVYLRRHLITHGPKAKIAKPSVVSCEICGIILQNRNSYYLHKKKHEEPSYSCETCHKKFNRADTLKEHVLTHLESQFECNICSRKFKSKRLLKSHMISHDSVKTYKCPKCDIYLKSRPILNRHLKTYHRDNKNEKKISECYKCPVCYKTIKLRSSVLRHLRKLHANVSNIDLKKILPRKINHPDIKTAKIKTNIGYEYKIQDIPKINDGKIQSEVDDQIDLLLTNARNNLSIQKHAVDSLVEQLDIDGKLEERQSREVCLSIPDLGEEDQAITLSKNAYILENGTIVQPQENSENIVIYFLDQNFS